MLPHTPDHDLLADRIKEYRDQSWQIEILIAGGTVITLASITETFKQYFLHAYPIAEFSHYSILILFAVYLVTRVLLIGFIANLILRSVWLAYLGINFSFPSGVNYDRLGGNENSKRIIKNSPNILQRVISLEKLCHLSYSLAILLALLVASAFISLIGITYVLQLFGAGSCIEEPVFAYIISFLIIFTQIGLLDRLLLKSSKNNNRLSKLGRKISKIFSIVTLSFLFRREILVLKTNTNKWLTILAVNIILVLATIISANQIGEYWSNGTLDLSFGDSREYYDVPYSPLHSNSDYDHYIIEGKVAFRACIQSEIIEENYIKLFVVYWNIFDKFLNYRFTENNYPLERQVGLNSTQFEDLSLKSASIFSKSINETLAIKIDNTEINNLEWKRYTHPRSKEEGYLTFINIDSLESKRYELEILVNYYDNQDSIKTNTWEKIPFWKN